MREKRVQLILPKQLHKTFTRGQQPWLLTVSAFIELVSRRQ
jgi:hypothetical protein